MMFFYGPYPILTNVFGRCRPTFFKDLIKNKKKKTIIRFSAYFLSLLDVF